VGKRRKGCLGIALPSYLVQRCVSIGSGILKKGGGKRGRKRCAPLLLAWRAEGRMNAHNSSILSNPTPPTIEKKKGEKRREWGMFDVIPYFLSSYQEQEMHREEKKKGTTSPSFLNLPHIISFTSSL